ncbi:MAG: hypothetical protein PHO46_07470 [Thermoguttaceae bacterium]|jgi:tetratricopeptide (TPR) repeat protein|nr:hypothetical protein [Thermoguttaceae bacterium]
MIGCSSFQSSGSADYVGPDGLSQDVSGLPDPAAMSNKSRNDSTSIRTEKQYGYGQRTPEPPQKLLFQANSHFDQKRYHDSAQLYNKYLATPEGQASPPELLAYVHYRLGYIERKKMFFSKAADEFKIAVQYAPQNDDYLFAYAKASYEAADYQGADQGFVSLLNRTPTYPEAEYYYGLTLLESTNRTDALQPLIATAGELKAHALLTDKYYAKGELEKAFQAENQTIQVAARLGRQIPDFPHKNRALERQAPFMVGSASAQPVANVQGYVAGPSTSMLAQVGSENMTSNAQAPGLSSNAYAQGYVPSSASSLSYTPLPGSIPTTEGVAQSFESYAPSTGPKVSENFAFDSTHIPMTENVVENVGSFAPTTTNEKNNLGAAESQAALATAPMPAQGYPNVEQFGYAPQFVPQTQTTSGYAQQDYLQIAQDQTQRQPISNEPSGYVVPYAPQQSLNEPAAPPSLEIEDFAFATSGVASAQPTNAPAYVAAIPNPGVQQYIPTPYIQQSIQQTPVQQGLPENSLFKID